MSGRLAKIIRGTELEKSKFKFTEMKAYTNGKTALINYGDVRGRVGIQTPLLKTKGLLAWKQKMDNSLSFELVIELKDDDKFTNVLRDVDDLCKREAKKDPVGWLDMDEYSDPVFKKMYKPLIKESSNKETGEKYPSTFTIKLLTDENLTKFLTDKKNKREVTFTDKLSGGTIEVDLQDFVKNVVNKAQREPKDNKPFIYDTICSRGADVSAVFYFSHVNCGQTGLSVQRRLYCARVNNQFSADGNAEMLPDEGEDGEDGEGVSANTTPALEEAESEAESEAKPEAEPEVEDAEKDESEAEAPEESEEEPEPEPEPEPPKPAPKRKATRKVNIGK